MKYSMAFLEKKFDQHAIEAKKMNDHLIVMFKENNPGEPLPDHFKDDFSLPSALASICKEILRLEELRK